jgi:hypothetical protein
VAGKLGIDRQGDVNRRFATINDHTDIPDWSNWSRSDSHRHPAGTGCIALRAPWSLRCVHAPGPDHFLNNPERAIQGWNDVTFSPFGRKYIYRVLRKYLNQDPVNGE